MVTVKLISVIRLGRIIPEVQIISRGEDKTYKTLIFPSYRVINRDTIKDEVARQWGCSVQDVEILPVIKIPRL